MPDRVFTEEEVREIVRRASEQQAEDAERREAREHGLTLDDLERLGEEVGLDPVYLRAAADAVQSGRRPVSQTATQTDTHVIVERRIDQPYTPEAWEDTVAMLRQHFGVGMGMWMGGSGEGRVEQIGNAHEWAHVSQLGVETRVSVSERGGQTRLLLSQRVGQAAPKVEGIGIAAGVGFLAGVLGGIPIADAFDSFWIYLMAVLAIAFVVTAVGAPLVTRFDKKWRAKKHGQLKDLAADVERTFAEAAPVTETQAAALPEPEAPVAARLDLDALTDTSETEAMAARRRTRS